MLVLTRKTNESIVIGSRIRIRVLESHKGRVKLGVSGPREVPVCREEVYQRIESNPAEQGELHAFESKAIS